jgi:hypothetical protein
LKKRNDNLELNRRFVSERCKAVSHFFGLPSTPILRPPADRFHSAYARNESISR